MFSYGLIIILIIGLIMYSAGKSSFLDSELSPYVDGMDDEITETTMEQLIRDSETTEGPLLEGMATPTISFEENALSRQIIV